MWLILLKNVKGMNAKERLKNCPKAKKTKESVTTKCSVLSCINSKSRSEEQYWDNCTILVNKIALVLNVLNVITII